MRQILLLLLALMTLTSCRKEYYIVYDIKCDVDSLTVIYQKTGSNRIDTNLIHWNSTIRFDIQEGHGMANEEFLEGNMKIPLEMLIIRNSEQENVNFNPLDPEKWRFIISDDRDDISIVRLDIDRWDFQ